MCAGVDRLEGRHQVDLYVGEEGGLAMASWREDIRYADARGKLEAAGDMAIVIGEHGEGGNEMF